MIERIFIIVPLISLLYFSSCVDPMPTCATLTIMNNNFYRGHAEAKRNGDLTEMKSAFYNRNDAGYEFTLSLFSADTCQVIEKIHLELMSLNLPDTLNLMDYGLFDNNLSISSFSDDVVNGVFYMDLDQSNWISITDINSDTTVLKGSFSFSFLKDFAPSEYGDSLNYREGTFISEFLKL